MNFDLDDDQRSFARTARDWYTASASPADVRASLETGVAPAPGLAGLAEMGFLGITVPESAGGAGQSVLDLAVVAEQGGRVLAGPSLVTAARAAVLLDGLSDRLASLADGSVAYAVLDGPTGGSHPSIDAASASAFLALDGRALLVGDGERSGGEPMDPSRGLASVRLTWSEVLVPDAAARWERATRVACVVMAAEDLGTAERALELGVEYAKMREAFGRPIGSYQAVKHQLVDAYVQVQQLRSLVWWAAWAADHQPAELAVAASSVKAYAADTVEQVTETVIQVHGGIGFTWEHDAHLYWRRGKVDRLLLGDAATHRDAVARYAVAQAAADGVGPDSPPDLSTIDPTAEGAPSLSGAR